MIKKARCSAWHLPLHYAYVIFFILLTILLPLLYSRTGYPPLWFIWTLLGTLLFFYAVYWIILYIWWVRALRDTKHDGKSENSNHSDENSEDQDIERASTAETYNPSTMGIPPSSFLAQPRPSSIPSTLRVHDPTNFLPSIRSSIEYNPPPPAYQLSLEHHPPSYHSSSSAKDDDDSIR